MEQTASISIIAGPSVTAPFAAVLAEFDAPAGASPGAARLNDALEACLTPTFLARVPRPLPDGAFETVVAALAAGLRDGPEATDLPFRATRGVDGRCRVFLGYRDAEGAALALHTALDVTMALFQRVAGRNPDLRPLAQRLAGVAEQIAGRQPDPLARALQRAAARRGIPVLAVAPGARVWQFGQGAAGRHFFEAATQADAMTGSRLARNKQHANAVIRRLGFPGTRHASVNDVAAARRRAETLGYPVVIKPVDGSKGRGVTVDVRAPADVDRAFAHAQSEARAGVLVEAFVAGDDIRLVVAGGVFSWAVRRSPPQVTGDGAATLGELVATENARRRAAPNPHLAGQPLALDAEALEVLARQGLTSGSRPAAGVVVALGRIANVARGGTIADCSDAVHPDIRAMAESIARGFRLDTVGIDFITPDVTRSWRDVPCAVIEVNATPGFSSDARAELILERHFPGGRTGRVPSVLLVDGTPGDLQAVAATLATRGLATGWSDAGDSGLGTHRRFQGAVSLADRARGLLLDPGCEALVLATTTTAIAAEGLPLDRFELALVSDASGLSPAARSLLRELSRDVRANLPADRFATDAADALTALPAP